MNEALRLNALLVIDKGSTKITDLERGIDPGLLSK